MKLFELIVVLPIVVVLMYIVGMVAWWLMKLFGWA